MTKLILPEGYKSDLNLLQTQKSIKLIKDFFERALAEKLKLTRVSAPMFVKKSSGLNDDLTGVEKPVHFYMNESGTQQEVQIVHSLAKWKRYALKKYEIPIGQGLYTDMNAIRADETPDNIHSIYVDQWDWEKVIDPRKDRNMEYLIQTVKDIYSVFLSLEEYLLDKIPGYEKILPDEIFFLTTQELEDRYPNLNAKERERAIAKEKRAVFLLQIGDILRSGHPHDGRSPDYDDWSLNGDLLFWNPILDDVLELSSMGIRVDPDTLVRQLRKANAMDRMKYEFHSLLVNGMLPQTIGGGIGQSRICMFFLQKAHIGEVQASVWPENMRRVCRKNGIELL